ncbi:MAG TPA: DMT family transporter [Candidatus Dormibacteraeota bacterium]|nr:DMT family transporter [Candidatus Dormibacteraeota bacterium]
MRRDSSRVAEGTLLLITAIWGTTFPLLSVILHRVDAYTIVAVRFSIAALVLCLIYRRRLARMGRQDLWDGIRTGLFLVGGYLTQAIGLTTISVPRSAFLTGTAVVFMPFIAFLVQRSRVRLGEILGVALVFVGLLIFYADAGLSLHAGDLWTLAGAVFFACQVVYTNVAARRSDPFAVSAMQALVSGAMGWIFVAARGKLSVPTEAWGTLLYLGVIATALILVLQTWALGKTKPVRAGVIYSLEPVFASLFAMGFFGAHMSGWEVLGSAAILSGVLVAELKKVSAD